VYLPTIPEAQRQDEKTFWRTFEATQPQLLGALLDVMSAGLRTLPSVQLDHLPQMADFAMWACAAAAACGWTTQDFLDAYQGVRKAAHELTLYASAVAPFVRALVAATSPWQETASALLTALEALVPGGMMVQGTLTATASSHVTKHKTWPKNGRALSNALRRLAPALRAVGVDVQYPPREPHMGQRLIVLTAIAPLSVPPSGTSSGTGTPQGQRRVQGSI
jgi:uncharacterized membrane protein YjjB (DUF3815 family)